MMNSLKLASVNIHGLRNSTKRKTFFRYLKKGAFDIICILDHILLMLIKRCGKENGEGHCFIQV